MHTTSKERNGTLYPAINYRLKSEVSIRFRCQLHMFNLLHSITNQEPLKKYLCNQIKVADMKNTDDFCYEGKPSHATTK